MATKDETVENINTQMHKKVPLIHFQVMPPFENTKSQLNSTHGNLDISPQSPFVAPNFFTLLPSISLRISN